jgi:signal transduction histidine kinase/CheY-like chemotaxis protein
MTESGRGKTDQVDRARDGTDQKAHHGARESAGTESAEVERLAAELHRAKQELEQRTRALEDASQAKARFLATMSHELRTPLNAVLGYAGLLRDGVYGMLTEQQQRAVRSIVRRARDLQLLIDDVLDLSRIEAGHMALREEEFDPATVLEEIREAVAPFARDKPLTVAVRARPGHRVCLDRGRYRQVVLNLVANAVKFTPRRGEVELTLEDRADHHFITRVRDTGIGIPQEDLQRVFESFQQLDSGTTRRYPGLGLGLSIARRIVELLGGTIEVESQPGHGTTFTVTLPTRSEAESASLDAIATGAEQVAPEDPVIIAIDDDPEMITLLRESLAPAHFRVVGARSGDRGLELARALHPLAITLDIMMPEKDGWQVLREIRSDPALAEIPVIVMSIVSESSLAFSLGVTDYLVKPVERRVLIDVLERLRSHQSMRRALVVDDDRDARTMLRDLLTSLGFSVRVATRREDAIAELAREVPELLFLDTSMPEREVSQLLETVARDPRLSHLRTILLASHGVALREHPEWLRRAAATLEYSGSEAHEELLRELKVVVGAP